jgi:hypothetical protein
MNPKFHIVVNTVHFTELLTRKYQQYCTNLIYNKGLYRKIFNSDMFRWHIYHHHQEESSQSQLHGRRVNRNQPEISLTVADVDTGIHWQAGSDQRLLAAPHNLSQRIPDINAYTAPTALSFRCTCSYRSDQSPFKAAGCTSQFLTTYTGHKCLHCSNGTVIQVYV